MQEMFLDMTSEAGLRRFVSLSEKHLAAYKRQASPDGNYIADVEAKVAEAKSAIAARAN